MCRKKALELIARSEQYERGLSVKLAKRGFSKEDIAKTIAYMEQTGFLDDFSRA